MTYEDTVKEMRNAEVEALRKFYQDKSPLLEKLNIKLMVAIAALSKIAKTGNKTAISALEEMEKCTF